MFNFFFFVLLDFAQDWQLYFQDAATPQMEGIVRLHNHIMGYLLFIFFFVMYFFCRILHLFYYNTTSISRSIFFPNYDGVSFTKNSHLRLKKGLKRKFFLFYKRFKFSFSILRLKDFYSYYKLYTIIFLHRFVGSYTHHTLVELVWTIIPSIVLFFIAYPSFALLYSLDEVVDTDYNVKIIGHQWYWSYEYLFFDNYSSSFDMKIKDFDSYMIVEEELNDIGFRGKFRLLNVDNPLYLPIDTSIRLIVTSADVLHSWAVPTLGLKIDAVPGRLNQAVIFLKRSGIFFGQCSEICGVNHGFMPVEIHALPYHFWEAIVKLTHNK